MTVPGIGSVDGCYVFCCCTVVCFPSMLQVKTYDSMYATTTTKSCPYTVHAYGGQNTERWDSKNRGQKGDMIVKAKAKKSTYLRPNMMMDTKIPIILVLIHRTTSVSPYSSPRRPPTAEQERPGFTKNIETQNKPGSSCLSIALAHFTVTLHTAAVARQEKTIVVNYNYYIARNVFPYLHAHKACGHLY